jgi:carbon-monoxide dehydrogenase large subunit
MPDGDPHGSIPGLGRRRIGESVQRKEDDRFIQGQGRYSDDLNVAGQAYGAFVRSDYAHGHLISVSTAAAAAFPGV